MDVDYWCLDMVRQQMPGGLTMGTTEYGQAWISLNTLCKLANDMLRDTTAALVATGEMKIDHDGSGEKVKKIDMSTDMNSATLAIADSAAIARSDADAEGYAYAFTDTDELCSYLNSQNTEGWAAYLCTNGAAATSGAYGIAQAEGVSAGSASARAGALGVTSHNIYAEGKEIKKFASFVNTGAEAFAFTNVEAMVESVTSAYLVTYATSFAQTCAEFVAGTDCSNSCSLSWASNVAMAEFCIETYCTDEYCDTSYAEEMLDVEQAGESFASTLGTSFQATTFRFDLVSTYESKKGDSIEDNVFFGYDGAGYGGANATIECLNTNLEMEARRRLYSVPFKN